jgi:hypothetical protein
MNPLMSRLSASRENEEKSVEQEAKESEGKENRAATFDNFADMNMFTMKSMDACVLFRFILFYFSSRAD